LDDVITELKKNNPKFLVNLYLPTGGEIPKLMKVINNIRDQNLVNAMENRKDAEESPALFIIIVGAAHYDNFKKLVDDSSKLTLHRESGGFDPTTQLTDRFRAMELRTNKGGRKRKSTRRKTRRIKSPRRKSPRRKSTIRKSRRRKSRRRKIN